jgi:hypothetical protein
MKSKDQLLLEQSYQLTLARQILVSEGYTIQEIDALVAEGKVWDAVKRAGKTVGNYAAIGTAAAGMMGGSMAKADAIDDIVNQSRKDVASGISDSNEKFKNSMAEVNKQSKIDSAKLDVIEKRIQKELLPLIPKGYEAGITNIAHRINGITANGMANGRADYDKQQQAIDKVKQVMQKYSGSGMKQYDEVEKMLKSEYYKW